MAWVISLLGTALVAGGGWWLWEAGGYIRLDWGQAQTVAGSAALSGGVVTIAIAAVLFTLRDLARRPASAAIPTAAAGVAGASGVGLEAVHLADEAEAPAPARNRLAGRLATAGLPRPDRGDPAFAEAVATPGAPTTALQTEARPAPGAVEAEPVYDPRPRAVIPEAPRPAAPVLAEAPTVVGRYEANGASYVLFSDGTIEVETDTGTHRFASMADLKDHIERQDAG